MALTTVGIAKNLYDCGQNRLKYENQSQSILNELIQLRAQSAINYEEESRLIQDLEILENNNHDNTQAAVLDVGSKTVKVCAGPAAGFATKVVTQVAKKQNAGSDQGLVSDITDSLTHEVKNEATKTACKKTAEWAADWLGVAGMVGLMANPAVGLAVGTAAAASLLIPSVRESAYDFISSACKGTEAIIDETSSKLFSGVNKNQQIIDSYRKFEMKKNIYEICIEEHDEITSELENSIELRNEKIKVLKILKQEIKIEKDLLQDAELSLLSLNVKIGLEEILNSEIKNLNKINEQIQELEGLIAQDNGSLSDLKEQILLRKKKKLYRIVKHFNKSNLIYKLLTCIFSSLFNKYKKEKKTQDNEKSQRKLLEKNMVKLTSKVDRRKIKAKRKQEYIDTHPSKGDITSLRAQRRLKEDFIENQQVKVDSKKLEAETIKEFIQEEALKATHLSQEIDRLASKILNKKTKLDNYESDYVDTLI